jgi:hypothetical protein
MRRDRLVLIVTVLAMLSAGCASSAGGSGGSVKIVTRESAVGDDLVFIDAHTFGVRQSERRQMNQIAKEWARSVGADIALVQVTRDTGRDILFSVTAYRRPPATTQ